MMKQDITVIAKADLEAGDGLVMLVSERLPAGFPSPASDYEQEPLNIHSHLVDSPPSTIFARLDSDCLSGDGYVADDIVIIDRSLDAVDGDIVYALVNGSMTCKIYDKYGDGCKPVLRTSNPDYPDIYFSDGEELCIEGVVIGMFRKRRRFSSRKKSS